VVCAVAYTGPDRNSQAGFARLSSAVRANTANSFAHDPSSARDGSGFQPGLALSTANLYTSTQPGGFVAAMPQNYPVNQQAAFASPTENFGTAQDPLVGQKIGGFTAIADGVALYATGKVVVGGLGVAGDHPFIDHNIAWRVRNLLGLDRLAGAIPVSGDKDRPDNIVYDITPNPAGGIGVSASGAGLTCTASATSL